MDIKNNKGNTITLNDGQEKALRRMWNFLESDDNFLCLSGSAGTGKTTILKEAIKRYQYCTAITAPTHKAKRVAANMTGLESKTIHSLLGLRPDMDLAEFDAKNPLFNQSGKNMIENYRFVCIDEASMINKDLVALIKRNAIRHRCKIIFMGDIMQLPPVKESISSVFTDTDIIQVKLEKLERQKDGNPLINIYNKILSNIDSEIDLFERINEIVDGCGHEFFNDVKLFGQRTLDTFSSVDYVLEKYNYKLLCYTNDRVRKWNNYIRQNVIGDYHIPLHEGEILMSYTAIFDDIKGNVLQNSSEYLILSKQEDIRRDIKGMSCQILDVDTDVTSEVFIVHKESYDKFVEIEQSLLSKARSAKAEYRSMSWKQYYLFKNRHLILESIKDKYGRTLVKKDFDFSYAMTIHKSQGSTYKNILFDEKDANTNPLASERNRLKYVALSRPTNIAYINY